MCIGLEQKSVVFFSEWRLNKWFRFTRRWNLRHLYIFWKVISHTIRVWILIWRFFLFLERKKAQQTAKSIYGIYGDGARGWGEDCSKFKSWYFDQEYRELSGRPVAVDYNQIQMLIKINPGHMTQDIAVILRIYNMNS